MPVWLVCASSLILVLPGFRTSFFRNLSPPLLHPLVDLHNDIHIYLVIVASWTLFCYGRSPRERELPMFVTRGPKPGNGQPGEILERCVLFTLCKRHTSWEEKKAEGLRHLICPRPPAAPMVVWRHPSELCPIHCSWYGRWEVSKAGTSEPPSEPNIIIFV